MTSILDLPELPLANILSFLNETSLEQAQLVASPFLLAVTNNRGMMARRKIAELEFSAFWKDNRDQRTSQRHLQVSVAKTWEQREWRSKKPVKLFHFSIDNQGEVVADTEGINLRDSENYTDMPFHEWFALHFVDSDIDYIRLEEFTLSDLEISQMEECLRGRRIRIREVFLWQLDKFEKSSIDRVLRFVNLFAPQRFHVSTSDDHHPNAPQFLLTDSLFKMLPSLESFGYRHDFDTEESDYRWTRIPSDFYQFPPTLMMGTGWLVDISNVRKGLQEWAAKRLRIDCWCLILSIAADWDRLKLEIGLPVFTRRNSSGIFVKNCEGNELQIRSAKFDLDYGEVENVSFWVVGTGETPSYWKV